MRTWLLAGLAVVALAVWLWRSSTRESASSVENPVEAPRAPLTAPRAPTSTPALERSPRSTTLPRPSPFDASARHTADPCTAPIDPVIPRGFEQITAANITVAWEPGDASGAFDRPLRPVALAHAVAGLLEEAAALTGTDRREQLTVIVDSSPDALHARTRTPAWVGGLYDGGAVHVPARRAADLGVAMATLRHEVMHAHVHAVVGCVPFWFNEGLADYFAGEVPLREWIALVRDRAPFELPRDPAVLDLQDEQAGRLYAVSLAMIVYLVQQRGEQGIREAVRLAQSTDTPLALWEALHANVDPRALVDALAAKLFGSVSGAELEGLVRGTLCCRKVRQPMEVTCHPPSSDSGRGLCRRW